MAARETIGHDVEVSCCGCRLARINRRSQQPAPSKSKRPASLLLDRAYMNDVRARGEKGDAAIKAAIAALEEDAKKALAITPMSVMDKTITPPSGDKHDYMSQAPYWWPDPVQA